MVIVWGWGNQYRKIADAGIIKCGGCNQYTTFEIRELAKKFELYFIPIARWGKRYFLVCNNCEAGYELDNTKIKEILAEASEFPDNKTSIEIWEKIDELVAELVDNNDIEKWEEKILSELKRYNYKENEVEYVLSIYAQFLYESFKKQINNTEKPDKE